MKDTFMSLEEEEKTKEVGERTSQMEDEKYTHSV